MCKKKCEEKMFVECKRVKYNAKLGKLNQNLCLTRRFRGRGIIPLSDFVGDMGFGGPRRPQVVCTVRLPVFHTPFSLPIQTDRVPPQVSGHCGPRRHPDPARGEIRAGRGGPLQRGGCPGRVQPSAQPRRRRHSREQQRDQLHRAVILRAVGQRLQRVHPPVRP